MHSSVAPNLDETYGAAAEPRKLDAWEKKGKVPRSLSNLDAQNALLLLDLMQLVEKGLGVVKYVFADRPILWVVDREGNIWFALEETVDAETGEFTYPDIRPDPGVTYDRLGHPALIGCAVGRIAGELKFDPGPPGRWYINNFSGRYSRGNNRTEEHLNNVGAAFAKLGIEVAVQFY
ncbi:MAG: hypothetical protein JSR78_15245 [Proteobacteria bacterium]|nr:hypothetical protein [Pseudomonadota bacterium]